MITQEELLERMKQLIVVTYDKVGEGLPIAEWQEGRRELINELEGTVTIYGVILATINLGWDPPSVMNLLVVAATGEELDNWRELPIGYDI